MIKKLSENEYQVESLTKRDEFYNVKKINGQWDCDCPTAIYHPQVDCKHIVTVKMMLASTRKDQDTCPECGAYLSITKVGFGQEAVCRGCGYTEISKP